MKSRTIDSIKVVCPHCKESKMLKPYQAGRFKFCSFKCAMYSRRNGKRVYNCKRCGVERKNNFQGKFCQTCKIVHREEVRRITNLINNLRVRVGRLLKGETKSESTMQLTGCNAEFLKIHIQSKFKIGMNWNNYGKVWHVDHVVPCVRFNLKIESEQRKCFHFSNLQPLFATENLVKHDNIIECQPELILSHV